jgi:hypothetical protein
MACSAQYVLEDDDVIDDLEELEVESLLNSEELEDSSSGNAGPVWGDDLEVAA